MQFPYYLTVSLLALLAAIGPTSTTDLGHVGTGNRKPAPEPKPSLEDAYRAWYKGFASARKEDREQAIRSMMPTRKDIAYLFPKHVDKLWPKFEKGIQFAVANVDRLARHFTQGGAIKTVTAIDVRKDVNRASGSYKRILTIIPKDVSVFRLIVEQEKRSSGGGTYLFLNRHWFWIKDLDSFPRVLDTLK